MILVDSSVWIDHFRNSNAKLKALLEANQVLMHSFVMGELALGNLRQRGVILQFLESLPQAEQASNGEIFDFIEQHALFGLGIGYIDAHLLAATRLSGALLWTQDKRLQQVALRLHLTM